MELRLYVCKKVLIKAQSQVFIPEKLRNKDIINVVKPSVVPKRKKIYFKLKRTKILTFISIALFPFQLQVWYSYEKLKKNLNLNKTSDLIEMDGNLADKFFHTIYILMNSFIINTRYVDMSIYQTF